VRDEIERALDGIGNGEVPQEAEFRLQRLHHLWSRYEDDAPEDRGHSVRETLRLLDELQTLIPQLQPAPIEYSNAPPVEPATQIPKPQTPNPSPHCSLDTELTYLKGIGPKRAEALKKLGLATVYDLLYYFPARYEDRRVVKPIAQVEPGQKESVCATVLFPPQTRRMGGRMGGGRNLTRVRVGDGSAHMDLQWWNQPFREKQFQPGMQLFLYGRISEFGGSLQMDSPEFEVMGEDNSLQVGRIVPVYPMTEGLFQTAIRRAIGGALERCAEKWKTLCRLNCANASNWPNSPGVCARFISPTTWSKRNARVSTGLRRVIFIASGAGAKENGGAR
jgi:ATP-dependent DNA helicase RecG